MKESNRASVCFTTTGKNRASTALLRVDRSFHRHHVSVFAWTRPARDLGGPFAALDLAYELLPEISIPPHRRSLSHTREPS